jgi:hypothetical protein
MNWIAKIITKLFMAFYLVKKKKKDKEPRYYPNEKQYPVEAFEIS